MPPSGWEHGRRTNIVNWSLEQYVRQQGRGAALGAETGFLLARNPDVVRAPDAAYVRQERVDEIGPMQGYWPGPPDLAVEVVSPGDRGSEVDEKIATWLAYGTRLVIAVYPRERRVRVTQSDSVGRELVTLDAEEARRYLK